MPRLTLGCPRAPSPIHPSNCIATLLHGRPVARLARVRERVEQQFQLDVARSSPARSIARQHALRGRPDEVHHQMRAQRLGLVAIAIGSSTASRSSSVVHRGLRVSAARRGSRRLDAISSNAPRATGSTNSRRVEPVDDELGLVHRPPQHVELAAVDADGVRGARPLDVRRRRRAPAVARLAARRARPSRGAGRRRCRARPRASSRTGRARARSDARRRCAAAGLGGAGPALERRRGRRPRARGRARNSQERRGPLDRGDAAAAGRRARRRRDRARREGRRPGPGSRTAAPTGTTSRPRPGRRRRRRTRAPPCGRSSSGSGSARRRARCRTWRPTLGTPASANAMTSV